MHSINVEEYLAAHESRQIRSGKSGAEVWEIEGKYVLKHVQRAKLLEPGVFERYQNEAHFYQFLEQGDSGEKLSCIPEVLEVQVSNDEILILMEKYQELSRDLVGEVLLRKIMRALAVVHTREIPDFLKQEQKQPGYLKSEQIRECATGWRAVLAEHPGAFDEEILTETADRINEIIAWHNGEAQVLSHGDFHWDNLLCREDGEIVICDWQGVNAGGASGDISFFLSRLGADGIVLEPQRVVELYCNERFLLTGEKISRDDMLNHMIAANIITTFQFWHQYLHGSACERVRESYEKMAVVTDFSD